MVYIDESRLSIQDVLHTERHRLKIQDAHEASISRKGGMNLEMEQVLAQVDERDFDDEPCPCGYEEGRSEADKRDHEENCTADGDRAWDKFKDNATDEEMATFEREAFFASASDPASDESELVATAYRLGIGTKEFEAHREREGGAAREAF